MRFSGSAFAVALLCSASAATAEPDSAPASRASAREAYGPLSRVPPSVLGRWKLTGQECEEEGDPLRQIGNVFVTFNDDFSYEMNVEGWRFVGKYRVDRFIENKLRIQFEDTAYNFEVEDGRLANWSEGDAVYLCGNIFTRDES